MMGHDIHTEYDSKNSVTKKSCNKTLPGTLTYFFCGKVLLHTVLKVLLHSKSFNIAFACLDKLGVYGKTPNLTPSTLFDAHNSQLQVPIVRYINNLGHILMFFLVYQMETTSGKWVICESIMTHIKLNGQVKNNIIVVACNTGLRSSIRKNQISYHHSTTFCRNSLVKLDQLRGKSEIGCVIPLIIED